MLTFSKPYLPLLLSLLLAVALADAPNRDWQITGLNAADSPLDAAQTGPYPVLHHIGFNVTDESDVNTVYECSATWAQQLAGTVLPPSAACNLVEHSRLNATFNYTIVNYESAADGFQVNLEEIEQAPDLFFSWNGTGQQTGQTGGSSCAYTPLPSNPDVTFASCSWPSFTITGFLDG